MWEDGLRRYDALVDMCPRFQRKGKTMPYTSANGHMFSLFNKAGELGIRFAKDVQERYMEDLDTTNFESYGAVMKGYVLIPEPLFDDMERLAAMLNESYDYVMSLDPK